MQYMYSFNWNLHFFLC